MKDFFDVTFRQLFFFLFFLAKTRLNRNKRVRWKLRACLEKVFYVWKMQPDGLSRCRLEDSQQLNALQAWMPPDSRRTERALVFIVNKKFGHLGVWKYHWKSKPFLFYDWIISYTNVHVTSDVWHDFHYDTKQCNASVLLTEIFENIKCKINILHWMVWISKSLFSKDQQHFW